MAFFSLRNRLVKQLEVTRPRQIQKAFAARSFSSSASRWRVYNSSVRNDEDWTSLLSVSNAQRQPLITLWTASWCSTCKTVLPLVHSVVKDVEQDPNVPEIGFVEVELDSPDIGSVAQRYQITSIPLLLAFSRQEPQMETRVGDAKKLTDKAFLREWLEKEARRGNEGGSGGTLFGKLFGGGGSNS